MQTIAMHPQTYKTLRLTDYFDFDADGRPSIGGFPIAIRDSEPVEGVGEVLGRLNVLRSEAFTAKVEAEITMLREVPCR
jgi:hypothetical protein